MGKYNEQSHEADRHKKTFNLLPVEGQGVSTFAFQILIFSCSAVLRNFHGLSSRKFLLNASAGKK
jgi:hypothetical protein